MDFWSVTVLGDIGVGKTALAAQFTLDSVVVRSTETYDPGVATYQKQLVVDDKPCKVEVINTAGQEEYANFRDQSIREGRGFILVYSITSRETFEHIGVYHQAMLKVKRHQPVFVLVGNRFDGQRKREVSSEEGAATARDLGCEFSEISVKTAEDVEKLFTNLVRLLRSNKKDADRVALASAPPVKPAKPIKSVISRTCGLYGG